jgi:hypothetical protein
MAKNRRKNGRRKGRGNGGAAANAAGPPSTAIIYNGALRIPDMISGDRVLRRLSGVLTVTTSAAGSLFYGMTTGPTSGSAFGIDGANDWAAVSQIFQEYRVLGMEMTFQPKYNNTFATGGPGYTPGASYIEHTSNVTNPGSLVACVQNQSWKVFHPGRPSTRQWRMSELSEAVYDATTSLVGRGGIFHYCAGLDNSRDYGIFYYTWIVQFRATRPF